MTLREHLARRLAAALRGNAAALAELDRPAAAALAELEVHIAAARAERARWAAICEHLAAASHPHRQRPRARPRR